MDSSAERIGKRIRRARLYRGLKQEQLGRLVGLTGDRIQKYENGVRKPKHDILKQIADALDVDIASLQEPVFSTPKDVMYALFELEETYGVTIDNGTIKISSSTTQAELLKAYIREWEDKSKELQRKAINSANGDITENVREYDFWRWNFKRDKGNKDYENNKAKLIREQIASLEKELRRIEKN